MVNAGSTPPSSPTSPRLLDLFPNQVGDVARVVSSATREERLVSLAHLKDISKEEREIGIANNVSTLLTLSPTPDIWDIKKTLKKSDVGKHQTRLIIPKEAVTEHILKHLTQKDIRTIEDENSKGLRIHVYDSDEKSIHQLSFKRWLSTGSYVLNNSWILDFVERRKIEAGDRIGLFWNPYASRLHFCVLPPS